MSVKEKLIKRFLNIPKDFTYDETVKLLNAFGFYEVQKGKTSGSRVMFANDNKRVIQFHKPHPGNILKPYQMLYIKEKLIEYKLMEG
ncbi:MAG: type II toxin-antitoxin system HicA family toxin [Petrimonas sp.]|nr:type II toxin-antitoxin system HicA family toxin [Petrimonas sp.]